MSSETGYGNFLIKGGDYDRKRGNYLERKNRVLQDRLVKEFRLKGIDDISKANEIMDEFMEELNQRFNLKPAQEVNYHRQLPTDSDLDDLLRLERPRRMQKDWTFEYQGKVYQVEQSLQNLRPGKRLTICLRLDGTLRANYEGSEVIFKKIGNK